MARFPDDWIAPGEFQFCARCGFTLRPAESPTCVQCRVKDTAKSAFEVASAEANLPTHKQLSDARNALAESRRASGVKPLFWMEAA